MVKNIESRLDRLKRAIPGPGVGIMHQTETGWTVYRGALHRDFHSEEQAHDFLKPCKTVIVVDV